MDHVGRFLVVSAATVTAAMIVSTPARADDDPRFGGANRYTETNLTSDLPGVAHNTDAVLQNAWGVAFTPASSPFWISDNATGCSTLYDGQGVPQTPPTPLQVKIPLPSGVIPASDCMHLDPNHPPSVAPAAPTGLVWNPTTSPTTGFLVPRTSLPATFIWDTEDGVIAAWTGGLANLSPPLPADHAVLAADNSPVAVYKGLAFGINASGVLLYATNFRAGTVDVFDQTYTKVATVGGFSDQRIPAGFAPFGIQNINGDLFVTYAKQNAAKHDDVAGPGDGFVDVFDTDGHLLQRLASRGPLNSPWGIARASFAFGRFSGDILVGNFGDGRINAFDSDGNFLGTIRDAKGKPISIDGLWTLTSGGGKNSSPGTLYFTAGPNGETDGLFGTIAPLSADK
jgi:uncharacterized protein (TIGR03118 family)